MTTPHPRVLLIAPSLDIVGGQSVQARYLVDGLAGKHARVRLKFLPITRPLTKPWVHLQSIRYLRTLINSLAFFRALFAEIPRSDIVHVFASSYLAFWIVPVPVLLLARLFGKKAILHHHDGRTRNHLAESPASVLVSGLATVVVAPSGFLGSICESHGLPTRAILNALPADSFHYRERCCLRPAFFHNRALEKVYNPECTLRAFQIIQQRHPEATLTMAHDGSLRNELEALALQLGLRNVTFLGAVSFERMKDLYHASDIFLSSSDHDNMPCSVLEAFASGLPVIATRAGGTEWILEHNRTGLLVECGDYEAMARCAFRLLEEPTLALRLSRAARRESQRYRLSEVMDKWVSLYEQLEQGPLNSKAKQTVRGEAERSVC